MSHKRAAAIEQKIIEEMLGYIINRAKKGGFLIRVELEPLKPLAMRNVEMVAEVRPVLVRPEDTQEHDWVRASELGLQTLGKTRRCCRNCGIVEPRDTRKVSYCKGRTRVTLRNGEPE